MAKVTVEDIMKPGWLDGWIKGHNEFDAAGKAALEQMKKFDKMDKHRTNLEKLNLENDGLTKPQQKAWDELTITYPSELEKRTELFQKFIDMILDREIELPDWIKKLQWIRT